MKGLEGKTAIVTGATGHIGGAIAARLLREGATVYAHGRSPEGARQAADRLQTDTGGICRPLWADLSDTQQISAMFDAFGTQEKRLDILVNNAAALGLDGPFLQTKVEDWEAVFRVNVTAALLCTQLAARLMIPNQDGVIINISSNGARRGHRGRVAYDASKGALEAAGRSLALELAPYGIRVNNVVPGAIRTSRWDSLPTETVARRRAAIPLGREGLPDDVAGVVAFLCSVDAAYITGDTITVDGGMMAQLRPTRDDG
ncbi:MAG: SDR family oxidoreductase [Firmicutes bacterium]|nr:SDR family oxidoreductase [Bacillota bacterium]